MSSSFLRSFWKKMFLRYNMRLLIPSRRATHSGVTNKWTCYIYHYAYNLSKFIEIRFRFFRISWRHIALSVDCRSQAHDCMDVTIIARLYRVKNINSVKFLINFFIYVGEKSKKTLNYFCCRKDSICKVSKFD